MQKEERMDRYWEKDNFHKPQELKSKSSISQSVKSICTNIWYKLGGESIMTKRNGTNFDTLVMLGKNYVSFEMAERDFKQLFWFTYRKQLKIYGEKRTDHGWGCLIRVGQMLLANSLKRYFELNNSSVNEENIVVGMFFSNIKAFLDESEGIRGNYSFQRILQKGKAKFQLKAGDWFNISQICYCLMSLQNSAPMKGSQSLKMIYFNQTLIFLDEVFQKIGLQMCQCQQRKICCNLCNGQVNYRKKNGDKRFHRSNSSGSFELDFEVLNIDDAQQSTQLNESSDRESQRVDCPSQGNNNEDEKEKRFDLLLVVSTRISQCSIDRKNFQGILELVNMKTSLGMIGGVPNKGLYFVGSCDDNLIYLDPHLVQTPVNTFNLSKQLQSYHCQNLRVIDRKKLDPSIAFAFYIRNLTELSQLIDKIQKIKSRNPQAVPISYMWENEYRDQNEAVKSNEIEIDSYSPEFSFMA